MPVTPSDVYTIEFCVHNIVNPSLNYDVSLVSSIFGPNWDIHIPPELLSESKPPMVQKYSDRMVLLLNYPKYETDQKKLYSIIEETWSNITYIFLS